MKKHFLSGKWALAVLACLAAPVCVSAAAAADGDDPGPVVDQAIAQITSNPLELAVDIRTPYHVQARTSSSSQWCWPQHHTPWNGNWAFDIWADDVSTCGLPVYLRVSPSTLPNGTVPDKLRAKVINVTNHPYACASQNYSDGGYQQAFEIWATYKGTEIALGWVLFAHIDNRVYNFGDWIDDPMDVYIGTAFENGTPNSCWGSCHIHMEFLNYADKSCIEDNVCQNIPETDIAVWGVGSIVGKLGGDLSATQVCPSYQNSEKLPCATWDKDLNGCDQHGLFDPDPSNDTQDCGYYVSSEKCRPRGTANCAAGLTWECNPSNSETFFCSTWDGDIPGCDLHGLFDPNPGDDTQDCAYYVTSGRCSGRGTSNCAAGINCSTFSSESLGPDS